jgi:hypothetical protein
LRIILNQSNEISYEHYKSFFSLKRSTQILESLHERCNFVTQSCSRRL